VNNQVRDNWKILLVDDDWDDFLIIQDILREKLGGNYELLRLASGNDYVKAICSIPEDFDVALVEYRFDHVDGLKLIKSVNETCPRMPCILMTDWPNPNIEEMAKQYGAHGFLRKRDLTSDKLIDKISEVLEYRKRL
jgi:DNA-binding NtrC family response regulator